MAMVRRAWAAMERSVCVCDILKPPIPEVIEPTAECALDELLNLGLRRAFWVRSEEHTSELQSLMRISYAVFCLKKKNTYNNETTRQNTQDKPLITDDI